MYGYIAQKIKEHFTIIQDTSSLKIQTMRSNVLAVVPITIISVIWDVTLCCTDTLQHSAKFQYISIKLYTITFPKIIIL